MRRLVAIALRTTECRCSQGTSKTREKLAVVDELLAYWKVRRRARPRACAACLLLGQCAEPNGLAMHPAARGR